MRTLQAWDAGWRSRSNFAAAQFKEGARFLRLSRLPGLGKPEPHGLASDFNCSSKKKVLACIQPLGYTHNDADRRWILAYEWVGTATPLPPSVSVWLGYLWSLMTQKYVPEAFFSFPSSFSVSQLQRFQVPPIGYTVSRLGVSESVKRKQHKKQIEIVIFRGRSGIGMKHFHDNRSHPHFRLVSATHLGSQVWISGCIVARGNIRCLCRWLPLSRR